MMETRELIPLFAETYRQAALSGLNMRAATDILETIRSAMLSTDDLFQTWDQIDAQVNLSIDVRGLQPLLIDLREQWKKVIFNDEYKRIEELSGKDPQFGRMAWLQSFTTALTRFRLDFCKQLCESPLRFSESGDLSVQQMLLFTNRARHSRWTEAYRLYTKLAERDELAPNLRAVLLSVAAQIAVYYFYQYDAGKAYLERAEKLFPQEPQVFFGWGKFFLSQLGQENELRAKEWFQRLTEIAPDVAFGHTGLGECLERENDLAGAEAKYVQASKCLISPSDGYSSLLDLCAQKEVFQRRRDDIPLLVERAGSVALSDRDIHEAMLRAGYAFQLNGVHDQAHEWYRRAIAFDATRLTGYTSEGYLYLDDKLYPKTAENFRRAIDVAPEAMEGYWGMALLSDEQSDWKAELRWCEESLKRRPEWGGLIHARMGKVKEQLNEMDGALEEFLTALTDDPKNNDAFQGLERSCEAYFSAGRLDQFEERFEKSAVLANEPSKKASIWNRIGNLFYKAPNVQDAIPSYQKAIELDPKRPIYECNLGLMYANLMEWERAIEHYTRAIELRKKTPDDTFGLDYYYGFLAEAYFKSGKLEEFESLFSKSGDLDDEPAKKAQVYNQMGNLLFGAGSTKEAIPYYEKAIGLDPKRPIYECNLGLTYANLARWERAIEHYTKAIKVRRYAPEDAYGLDYYYGFLAEAYFKSGKLEEFESLFSKSGDLDDEPAKKAQVYNQMGNLLFGAGSTKEAIPYYEKAIGLDPKRPIYECNLGFMHAKLAQWNNAIEHYKRAIELRTVTPNDEYGFDYYYGFLAEACFNAGKLGEFEDLLQKSGALDGDPEKKSEVYDRIGNLLIGAGSLREAIPYYEKAIGLDPKRPIYECNLGLTYENLGQWEKAIEHCTRAVELRKSTPGDTYSLDYYYGFLAEVYVKSGRLAEFEDLFQKSGALENEPPKKADVYNRIGNVLFGAGSVHEAISYYQKAIELDPKRPIYQSNLGLMYANLAQWERAIEHYRRAIELRTVTPDDEYGFDYYYGFLAEACFNAGKLGEFEELLQKSGALDSDPEKKSEVYDRIGNLLFEAGSVQEAISYYQKAMKLDPKRPIYESNLGLMYATLAQWDKAIEHYRRAIDLRNVTPGDPYDLDYYYDALSQTYLKAGKMQEYMELVQRKAGQSTQPV